MEKEEKTEHYSVKAYQAVDHLDPKIASIYCARIVSSDPLNPNPYMIWGYLYEKQKNWDAAISKYKKAVDLAPFHPSPLISLGLVLLVYKEAYEECITIFERCIELDPTDRIPYINLGYTYHVLGEYDTAIAVYNQVISMYPDYGYAYSNIAYVLFEKEKPTKKSIGICRKGALLMKAEPGQLEAYQEASYKELDEFEERVKSLPEGPKKKKLKRTIAALKFVLDILDDKPLDYSLLVYD